MCGFTQNVLRRQCRYHAGISRSLYSTLTTHAWCHKPVGIVGYFMIILGNVHIYKSAITHNFGNVLRNPLWSEVGRCRSNTYILTHSLILPYRAVHNLILSIGLNPVVLDLLRACGVQCWDQWEKMSDTHFWIMQPTIRGRLKFYMRFIKDVWFTSIFNRFSKMWTLVHVNFKYILRLRYYSESVGETWNLLMNTHRPCGWAR